MAEFYDFEVGSFDIQLTISAMDTGQALQIATDTAVRVTDWSALTGISSSVEISRLENGYRLALKDSHGDEIEQIEIEHPAGETRLQVTGHDDAISVFMDDRWLHTFFPTYVHYEVEPSIRITGNAQIMIREVLVSELFDCRGALEIDLQNSMMNAASSVLGQKPIKAWSTYDGAVCYAYNPPAGEATFYRVTTIERRRSLPNGAASDALVMHQRLAAMADLEALREFGLMTRLVRAPELGAGAIRVGRQLLENGRQAALRYGVTGPVDPRIELFDVVTVWATTPGAEVGYSEAFIVDNLAITGGLKPGMRLEGNQR